MGKTKRYPGVYQILNVSNGKSYIGSSKNCLKRMQYHRNRLRSKKHKNSFLQKDWDNYRHDDFVFRILEHLDCSLSKKELETFETKWVIHFKSNLSEYGYNITLPGNIRQQEEEANQFNSSLTEYVCISKEKILFLTGQNEVSNVTSISLNKIVDLSSYWKGKGKRKSLHGWIIVKKEDYNPLFDYLSYRKERVSSYKYGKKLSPKEYYRLRKDLQPDYRQGKRKSSEEIIPYEDRNLKRVGIVAVNISTGEEKHYRMMKDCYNDFLQMKVRKCINAPYGKYKHRGHYFKRA
jgi:group I intron endonuclease